MSKHGKTDPQPPAARLPERPVERWLRPVERFMRVEASSGVVLLACAVVALVVANSPWAHLYHDLLHTELTVTCGGWKLTDFKGHPFTLELWVNDGLMVVFFFVVGLEIKREIVAGELRDPKKAALPVLAALGGMIFPALIYCAGQLVFQRTHPGFTPAWRGWGIPTATDIAFVVGFLAMLGPRVPPGLKILLLTLAIADDLGAVLVIAVFYTDPALLSLPALGLAASGLVLCWFLRRIGVRSVMVYVFVGVVVWYGVLQSGVHATVAGVLLALLTPSRPWLGEDTLLRVVRAFLHREKNDPPDTTGPPLQKAIGELMLTARESVSPLERLEHWLHPWVAYLIMPVFALANAGVHVEPAVLAGPIGLSVGLGLIFGKPLGIVLFSWLGVRLGLGRLPTGVNWRILGGAGCLGGIGFTMALFVAGLAFDAWTMPQELATGKMGTFTGSAVSALVGCVWLWLVLPKKRTGE